MLVDHVGAQRSSFPVRQRTHTGTIIAFGSQLTPVKAANSSQRDHGASELRHAVLANKSLLKVRAVIKIRAVIYEIAAGLAALARSVLTALVEFASPERERMEQARLQKFICNRPALRLSMVSISAIIPSCMALSRADFFLSAYNFPVSHSMNQRPLDNLSNLHALQQRLLIPGLGDPMAGFMTITLNQRPCRHRLHVDDSGLQSFYSFLAMNRRLCALRRWKGRCRSTHLGLRSHSHPSRHDDKFGLWTASNLCL